MEIAQATIVFHPNCDVSIKCYLPDGSLFHEDRYALDRWKEGPEDWGDRINDIPAIRSRAQEHDWQIEKVDERHLKHARALIRLCSDGGAVVHSRTTADGTLHDIKIYGPDEWRSNPVNTPEALNRVYGKEYDFEIMTYDWRD